MAFIGADNNAEIRQRLLAGTLHGPARVILRRMVLAVVVPLLPLRLVGLDQVPADGKLLVVSNHVSNADPPLLELAFPRPLFFLGKSELFGVPFVGWLIRRFGGHPIERGAADRAALRHAQTVIEQEIAMAVFPEGGRSRSAKLVRALPGVGLLALESRCECPARGHHRLGALPGEWRAARAAAAEHSARRDDPLRPSVRRAPSRRWQASHLG